MKNEDKKQRTTQWAKISLDIKSDAKWYVLKRVIKQEINRDFRATDICNVFMQYCFASKKARKPIDVGTLVFDRELLVYDETVANVEDIDILNKYFIRIGLLTKRRTVTNYYKWNDGDELQTQTSANTSANICKQFANIANGNANTLQTEMQTLCKPTSRTHPAEYTTRYRLLKKQKNQVLTEDEHVLLSNLNNFFANANNDLTANLQTQVQTLQTEMQTCKHPANTPLEKEEEKEKEEEVIKEKNNKKENLDFYFDKFWNLYPNKKAKDKAEKIFTSLLTKATNKEQLFEEIINGLNGYNAEIQAKQTSKEYIAHPSTWLNQKRWQDEYQGVQEQNNSTFFNNYDRNQTVPATTNNSASSFQNCSYFGELTPEEKARNEQQRKAYYRELGKEAIAEQNRISKTK